MYNKKVIARFSNPTYAGKVIKPDAVAEVISPICGDIIKVFLRIDGDEVIRDAKFKVFGSVATIACADVMCELIMNKSLDDALLVTNKDIFEVLEELPAHKIYSASLAQEAIKEVIANYYDIKAKEAKKAAKARALQNSNSED